MNADKMIELCQALKDGKKLEFKEPITKHWITSLVTKDDLSALSNRSSFEYRVKKESLEIEIGYVNNLEFLVTNQENRYYLISKYADSITFKKFREVI